jgi:predicted Zn-dependent protease
MCARCFSRRSLIAALSATALVGCSENAETGRRQLAFIPDGQLAQLADQSWEQMRGEIPVSTDPVLNARLDRVGAPLAAAAGRPDLNWEFVVFDSDDLNAFVLPNGKVGFFRGLMALAADDDELGSVMSHEVAHVIARHASERVSQQLAVQAGVSIASVLLGGENGENSGMVAGALGLGAKLGVLLPYSRNHELEADRIGLGLMRQVEMDPAGAIRFWEKMIAEPTRQGQPPEALATHPADDRRLEALREAVAAA